MIYTTEKGIKHKVDLLNLVEEIGNVSNTCEMVGLSYDMRYGLSLQISRR